MISFQVDDRQWVKLATKLVAWQPRVQRAIRQGVQDAGNKTLTQVRRALKEQTGVVKYNSILVRTGGGSQGDGSFVIYAKGPALPITALPVMVTASGVVAYSWGERHAFKRSFLSGGRYMARLGPDHSPTRRLLGPNLAKELGKDKSYHAFDMTTRQLLAPAIVYRLNQALR